MLRACRGALKRGGILAFFTILVPVGLPADLKEKAVEAGPTFVASDTRDHRDLLQRAGFTGIEEIDVSQELRKTVSTWIKSRCRHAEGLAQVEGAREFDEEQRKARRWLRAIKSGILRRSLFVARRV